MYNNLDFIDGSSSCASSSLSTEFPINRTNQTCGASIDIDFIQPLLADKWYYIHYGKTVDNPADTCISILQHDSSAVSGMYWLTSTNGPVQMYCDFEGTNCDSHGGWMRIAKVDLADENYQNCLTSSFEKVTISGIDLCRRVQNEGGCVSAYLNVQGKQYSMVCGKARGYQYGTTDSFGRSNAINLSPDSNYVDGISITYDTNPRKHIFTFASGCSETGACWSSSECPCQTGSTSVFPKFLGYNDFYCESGSYNHPSYNTLYTEQLWDGLDCDGDETPCCTSSRLPWFYQALHEKTTSNVEFRLCSAGPKSNEDVAFDQIEIYVK